MEHLKEATAEAHRQAESRPLMRAIARGTVGRPRYVAHLEQLLLVHRTLEAALGRAAAPGWTGLGLTSRHRVPDLEADLRSLGGSLTPAPLPATTAALAAIERSSPLELLGRFYVTEGSTNGGRFLVKMVARSLALDPAARDGLRAIDPYGDQQPERWASFKGAMNALGLGSNAFTEIETGARRMFEELGAILEAIDPGAPA
jgi:heme oxygenase